MDIRAVWRRVERDVNKARDRNAVLDHVMATLGHYARCNGNGQAGAVTYHAFLAFFPVTALAFFVVGLIANVYPDAQDGLTDLINDMLGGLIGEGPGQISLTTFQDNAATAGIIGLAGFLFAGLGWTAAMRASLITVFEMPHEERPNFFMGRLRDIGLLIAGGLVLLAGVALTTLVNRYSANLTHWLGLDRESTFLRTLVTLAGVLVALLIVSAALYGLFGYLARPNLPRRALVEGAVLSGMGFMVLWLIADRVISWTHGRPAFTVLGFSLVLLILINYFSRVIFFGASWAATHPRARGARREVEAAP